MANTKLIPLESEEQVTLFEWIMLNQTRFPHLQLLFAIPNGGSRNKIEAANLKKQGVRAGVPDIFLPVARGDYHGLFIELKRQKGSTLTAEQKEWIELLAEQKYKAVVCRGFTEAKKTIEEYLRL